MSDKENDEWELNDVEIKQLMSRIDSSDWSGADEEKLTKLEARQEELSTLVVDAPWGSRSNK